MSVKIPESHQDLFQKRAFAHLATIMPGGHPQVTPVWVDYDGTHLLVNSARGRQKDLNMRRQAKVGLEIMDPDNPYRYLGFLGTVVEVTEDGAEQHIDKLAHKYTGAERYADHRPDQPRVIYKIMPDRVWTMG